ncbi:MAG: hypothetical protein IKS17_06030 [Firmicutes bacterium]|nr:hypothetical protein [Bacillota bacterium]
MTPEKLLEIMGEIDDKYIEEADPEKKATVIKFNFGKLAGIAAGIAAVVIVGNYTLKVYERAKWYSDVPLGTSSIENYDDTAALAGSAPAEAAGECDEAVEENGESNFNNSTADSYALQGAVSNAAGKREAAAGDYAKNAMPEAVYEAEESMETADASDDGQALIDSSFSGGGRYTFFADTPESVLNVLKTEAARLNADTSEYFYMTENSKNILSPEYVRENIIKDLSPKALESDNYIYYITQHKNDALIGYIAIDESGNILENKLEVK